MKKIFMLLIGVILVCGCQNKENNYDSFKHYELNQSQKDYYNYIDKNGKTEVYVIADITPENYEYKLDGLFYEISNNDYILLDEIENNNSKVFQHENKLYVTACNSMCHYEYTLDKEKTSKKELNFKVSEVGKQLTLYEAIDLKDNNIYYRAKMYDSSIDETYWGKEYVLKCDLKTYKCEEEKIQNKK